MKDEKQIADEIQRIEKDNWHVLDCYPASIAINAPRALMQLSAITVLDKLYWILNIKRPKYKCDNREKLDY